MSVPPPSAPAPSAVARVLAALRSAGRRRPAAPSRVSARALDAVPDPVLIVDGDDRVLHVNRAVGAVLGYEPGELLGRSLAETLLLPRERDAHRLRVQFAASSGPGGPEPDAADLAVAHADGSAVGVRMSLQATAGGRRARVAVCLRETGSAHAAQAALDAAEGRQRTLKTVVDAIPDPIVAVNRNGRVVLRNPAGARRLAHADGEPTLPDAAWHKAVGVMRSGAPDVRVTEQHGDRTVRATRVPVRDDDGVVVGVVVLTRDVTAQTAAEAALLADKQAAEAAARANREFLATTSHEVRTLMSGVTGMTTLLQGTALDDEQADFVRTIQSSSEALLGVINDVLDLSKLEAGMVAIEHRPLRVRNLLKDALALVSQQAGAKGLELSSEVADVVPDIVHGDAGRIRQVLANLLTNAVKFTDAGSVRVDVGPGPLTDGGAPTLAFTVRDTGVGIAPDRLDAVFERFEQADASTARTHGGTGLGLSIARQLAQSMGGDLTAASDGQGSAFRFTVSLAPAEPPRPPASDAPARIAAPAEPEDAPPEPADDAPESTRPERAKMMSMDSVLPSARVLVVEDDAVLQRVTALTLRRLGYRPDVVGNGQEAVEAVHAQPYDVVLMDVMMPVMNGLDATRSLRADPGPHPAPAIVALTANALEEDRRKCLAAGCDAYLAKPVQPRHLATTIEKAIRDRAGEPATA